jgi:hypothetical protein
MNRFDLQAYAAISDLLTQAEGSKKEQIIKCCKNWPILLRVHGLAGLVNYGGLHADYKAVSEGFETVLGITKEVLLTIPHDEYLLHARLALQHGDAWSRAAKILSPEKSVQANDPAGEGA